MSALISPQNVGGGVFPLVSDFITWQREYNGVSAERLVYQEKLLLELTELGELNELTAHKLETFLSSRGHAPATIAKHIKMLRPYFKWLWRHKHITGDQLMELRGVKAPRGATFSKPKPYTRGEIGRFWRAIDKQFPWTNEADPLDNTPKRAEYWVHRFELNREHWEWTQVQPYARRLQAEAIVALALFGGLRRIEIYNLPLEDMHYDNAFVRVIGAAKNPGAEALERTVGWSQPMQAAVANWIEFRAQVIKPEHERPWLTLAHPSPFAPMSASTLAHMLGRIGDGYSLHRLRHTFATERLRAGMPIEKLQATIGHTNIAMTLRYAQIGAEDVVEATEQSNDNFVAALGREEEGDESGYTNKADDGR